MHKIHKKYIIGTDVDVFNTINKTKMYDMSCYVTNTNIRHLINKNGSFLSFVSSIEKTNVQSWTKTKKKHYTKTNIDLYSSKSRADENIIIRNENT